MRKMFLFIVIFVIVGAVWFWWSAGAGLRDYEVTLKDIKLQQVDDLERLLRASESADCFSMAIRYSRDLRALLPDESRFVDLNDGLEGRFDGVLDVAVSRQILMNDRRYRRAIAKRYVDLAEFCKVNGLSDRVDVLLAKALTLNGESGGAHALRDEFFDEEWGWRGQDFLQKVKDGFLPYQTDGMAELEWRTPTEIKGLSQTWAGAHVQESRYWEMTGTMDVRRQLKLLRVMDKFYERWLADWDTILPMLADAKKHRIFMFDNEDAYKSYMKTQGKSIAAGVPGHYDPQAQIAYFYDLDSDRNADNSLFEIMLHEGAHQLFYERAERAKSAVVPIWLSEGLSEYYSCLSVDGARMSFSQRYIVTLPRTRMIKSKLDEIVPLRDLQNLSKRKFLAKDLEPSLSVVRRQINYSTSAFLCFFLESGKHRADFHRYVRNVFASDGEQIVLDKYIDEDLDSLQKEFVDFVKGY